MPFILITCQNCGGQAQIEADRRTMCPYCGNALDAPAGDSGFAFAPDMQAAEQVQLAQPPVQQVSPAPQMNPAAFQYPPASARQPVQQFSPEQLAEGSKKRGFWYAMNIGMLLLQSLVLTFGIGLADYFYRERLGTLVILAWLLSIPVWAVFSALIRPDEAYLTGKPLLQNKKAQAVMHALVSIPATAAASGILYAFLEFLRFLF